MVFKGWKFSLLPSTTWNICFIIRNVIIHVLVYTQQNVCWLLINQRLAMFVYKCRYTHFITNAQTTSSINCSKRYAHKFDACDIPYNIPHSQVMLPVTMEYNFSILRGKYCFFQLFLSQSDSSITWKYNKKKMLPVVNSEKAFMVTSSMTPYLR